MTQSESSPVATDDGLENGHGHLDVRLEQLKYLYRNATTGLIANLILAMLLSALLWERLPQQRLLFWLMLLFVVVSARGYSVFSFWRKGRNNGYKPVWFVLFLAGTVINGLLWGMSLWLFAPFAEIEIPIFFVFTLGGLMAGAAATLAAMLSVYFSYVLVIVVPIALWFFLAGGDIYTVMGAMLIVYMCAMFVAGFVYRRTFLSTIELSNQLADAREQAEFASKSKSQFLSNMSHELRTPLNAILGFSELLRMGPEQSDDSRENIEQIHLAGGHLLKLINDLLDIAKIEAGHVDFSRDAVNCRALIDECVKLIQPIADKYQINLQLHDSERGPYVLCGDFFRLKQVLLNLLSNACKYSHPGASVDVSCQQHGDNRLRISVADSGRGIPFERQKELFAIYNRIGFERTEVEGSGMGLVITKQLVEQMGGSIGFESEPGKGSTFWLDMPLLAEGT